MNPDDFIIQMPSFLKKWMIRKTPAELMEIYLRRDTTSSASYLAVNSSDFMTAEGLKWFADRGLELREEAWFLGCVPNKKMIKHTDFSPCCFIYNLTGSYTIYWLKEEGILDWGQPHTMDYPFQPDGKIIKCSKYLDIKYKDENNLPIMAQAHSGYNDFTLIETSNIHYAISGPETFMFWSPRPLDITLDYQEVKRRILSQ